MMGFAFGRGTIIWGAGGSVEHLADESATLSGNSVVAKS